ncbi:MAG: GntR family transcriptional regulator [Alphaproteobacteria bacterium]|nr:GntR family transcriptional regulator [Alphaproteobacteria bacterium]
MIQASSTARLPAGLARRILAIARERALPAGARLTELGLAADLKVSRTPVRAALKALEATGWVKAGPSRGFVLKRPVKALPEGHEAVADDDAALYVRISRDRLEGELGAAVSEADLVRRYGVKRSLLLRVLGRLAEAGVIERRPGYGWEFRPAIDSPAARRESYRFRMLIEPAGLLEPGFRLDPAWVEAMRARHRAALAAPWRDTSSVAFYEMNAAFHEGLATASGNRFILMAVQQQNRLRRFLNVHWTYGHQRVLVNCREHLEMLDRLEAGDRDVAAALMRRHLEGAARLVPQSFVAA